VFILIKLSPTLLQSDSPAAALKQVRSKAGFPIITLGPTYRLEKCELYWVPYRNPAALPARKAVHLSYKTKGGDALDLVEAGHRAGREYENIDRTIWEGYFPFSRHAQLGGAFTQLIGWRGGTDVGIVGLLPIAKREFISLKLKGKYGILPTK